MRKTILGGIAVTATLGAVLASGAFASGGQAIASVNGGGQIFASASPSSGPGDTLAFTAQELTAYSDADGNARGQLQFVQRDASGSSAPTFHGIVTCANIDGNDLGNATFGGYNRDDGTLFQVRVVDSGTGNQGTDMIGMTYPTDGSNPCADQNDTSTNYVLARGNVTIHKQG